MRGDMLDLEDQSDINGVSKPFTLINLPLSVSLKD